MIFCGRFAKNFVVVRGKYLFWKNKNSFFVRLVSILRKVRKFSAVSIGKIFLIQNFLQSTQT